MGYRPFTIQLAWACTAHAQDVTLGIDKGSSVTGFRAVGNGRVLLSGEIHHRRDVKEKMETRRGHRRQRRNRLRYRQPRFLNRGSSKRSGRLPPGIRTNVEEVVRVVERIPLPDLVLVKGTWLKQVNSIYSTGRLAFRRIAGEPSSARTHDCRLLEKQRTIVWNKRKENATECHISKER